MSSSAAESGLARPVCVVRPPWPDELPRLADAFPQGRFNRPLHSLLLVAPGSPERIVGFAGVLEPVDGRTGLTCAIRPRFIDSPEADRLLAAAVRLARELGVRELRTADDLPPDAPIAPALARAGFSHAVTQEIWELGTGVLVARLDRLRARLARRPGLLRRLDDEFTLEPLGAGNLPGVKALLAADDLLPSERRYSLDTFLSACAYDPRLSLVVRRGERVVAVALVKSQSRLLYVEAIAIAADLRGGMRSPLLSALHAIAQGNVRAELPGWILPLEPARAPAALRLARRSGGRIVGSIITYSLVVSP